MKACIFTTHNELWKIYLYANHNLEYMFHVFFENISMTLCLKANYILRNILTTIVFEGSRVWSGEGGGTGAGTQR